jgi:hypothetical protein
MTLYLLDANVIIRAHEDYYPVERIPKFWSWMLDMAADNTVKMPRLIFNEITPSVGPLAEWIKQPHVREVMILDEPIDAGRAACPHARVRARPRRRGDRGNRQGSFPGRGRAGWS